MKRSNFVAHLLLLSANLFYGINFSVAKIPMPDYIRPFGIVLLRCFTAMIFFWLLVYFHPKKQQKIEKSDWAKLLFAAFSGVCINQLLFFKGLEMATPISASIIMTTTPISVLVVAWFWFKEKINGIKIIGVMLGLFGALLLIVTGKQEISTSAANPALGNTMIFVNALAYAVYMVTSKKLIQKYDSLLFMKWVFTFGFFMVLPFGGQEIVEAHWQEMTLEVYLSIGFILIFVSCLAYLFNTIGLKQLKPETVGMYIYSQPLFAVWIAIVLGADQLDAYKIIAGSMIFGGVYLVSKR